jgi:hypothetical protein
MAQPAPGMFGGGGGGGFLRGAMTTAAGVAGGALLFEGIRGLFGGHGYGGLGGGLGGQQPVVNETVINEYGNQPGGDADPNITNAAYDQGGDWTPADDGSFNDDTSFDDGGDDDDNWV